MAILMYHHIATCPAHVDPQHRGLWVPPEEFERQLKSLKRWGFVGVKLDQIVSSLRNGPPLPRRWVCLTFDDARVDNLTHAEPLCAALGFPMTVFAVSGWTATVGSEPSPEMPTGPEATLDAEGLRELVRRGHDVGGHTATHPRLTRLDSEQVLRELDSCRRTLGEILGQPPRWLAYPFGNVAPRIMELARQCGYEGAVTTIRDNSVQGSDVMALPRVMIQPGLSLLRFRYMLSPWYSLLHRWKNRRRWSGMRSS